jgi:VTC domain
MNDDASHRALEEFCDCADRIKAVGMAFVNYRREAFVSDSAESIRVTFDRHIVGHGYYPGCGLFTPQESSPPVTRGVLLELKYNGRAPRWMHDLVTSFNLDRMPFAKYVFCVNALKIDLDYTGKVIRR